MSSIHELMCPACGAQLPPAAEDARVVTCHFCQHQYELDKPAETHRHHHHSHSSNPPPKKAAAGGAVLVAIMLSVGIVGGIAALMTRSSPSKPEHEHDIDWDSAGDPPRLVDVNGDGTDDIVGTYWKPEKGESRGEHNIELAAFDGASHNSLWIAGPFGRSSTTRGLNGSTHVAVAGGRVVIVDLAATAHILDLKTGKEVQKLKLPDRVRAVCAAPNGPQVWLDVLGDRGTVIDVNRATVTAAPRPAYCPESAPGACLAHRGRSTCSAPRAALPGVTINRVLSEGASSVGIAVSDGSTPAAPASAGRDAGARPTRTSSTPLPVIVGINPATQAILWQTTLGAGQTPLAAPSSVAELAGDKVYAQYELKNGSWRLTALDAKTGTTIWDVKVLGSKHGDEARSLTTSSSRVYLAHGDWLDVFDRTTGQQIGNFGK